ncbi:MAG: aspartate aminotransferase family protein [Phenylobacterium sp.]|uniref:aspartate aminotransferase family protein n=1 Tax=Phenylobacterium sp. TaxID=1871053 RepID=UPI002727096E|nr:aspartate aminotransferase family protein [Phenylobacterium sp.]MDO8913403.1 aspartate aminotransferase family protein [Phenylobacterium sp.]MDO9245430.1 aspartate aminotransferase family protein [Phenylobacterium sp.]MDP3101249.1 aspartate aminotransferase family protein [Phenylobacterium sp.]MDP3633462.1 aspartate aminotransferase family protein [Phenylobacterium sp.]MDP3867780.1 aspartate aminotransferase family protein [Phenylobacterium sp.]
MGVYNRTPLAFERGEGARLFTTDGEAYLDCMAGIAVNALGHANPKLVQAVKDQAEKLWHVSNIFTIPGQEKLAKVLTDATFADEVFFTNSGAEAIECAIKTARKYHWAKGQPERIDIIGFEGSFHGRTLAAVNASGNKAYLEGFGPPMPGFVQLPYGDHEALKAAIGPTTAAILIEPVQGEGGARALPEVCMRGLRQLCDEHGILLIYDEIQCGLGRTGKLFAHEWAGDAAPDIMAVAKALGGGFPVGACLATAEAGRGMTVGSHGSTYGGNPLAMAVGLAAMEELNSPELLAHVREVAGYFVQQLSGLQERFPDVVEDIRGKGLLIGIKLKTPNREFMQHARDQHMLIAGGGDNCVRLLPPLTLTLEEAQEAMSKLEASCEAARTQAKAAA